MTLDLETLREEIADEDKERIDAMARVVLTGRKALDASFLFAQYCIEHGIEGDFVECGVYAGAHCAAMAYACQKYGDKRKTHLFDSFEGIPQAGPQDGKTGAFIAGGSRFTLEQCLYHMFVTWKIRSNQIKVHPGWFKDTVFDAGIGRIAILRLDGDLYSSTAECLEGLYSSLVPGGFLIIDDYMLAGCKQAVHEYILEHHLHWNILPIPADHHSPVYVKKSELRSFSQEQFKDAYKGCMAFVVGSGPSLRHITAEQSHDISEHIVIAVNSAILAFPDADYFLGCDAYITATSAWLAMKSLRCKILVDETFSKWNGFDDDMGTDSYAGIAPGRLVSFERFTHAADTKMLSTADKLILGSCSSHVAVHFAHVCGCSPIILLGMDSQLEDGKPHFTDFEDQPSNKLLYPDSLLAESFHRSRADLFCHFGNTWAALAENNPDIEIINCSGGVLEAFPRMTLDEVLAKHGE